MVSAGRTRALGQADGRAVAVGRDREHARGRRRGVAIRRRPPRRRRRDGRHERTGHLALTVRDLAGELVERSRNRTHVRPVDRRSRGKRAGVGLGLGDTSTLLHVGVQRDGDRGENADDRHDDEELDQREAALTAQRERLTEHLHDLPPSRGSRG